MSKLSNARVLLRVFTHLVKHDKDMPLTRAQVLMTVTMKPECLVKEIIEHTGLGQASVSRSLAFLGDKPVRGQKDGLGWVDDRPDFDDPRRGRWFLTPRGKQVIAEIETLME